MTSVDPWPPISEDHLRISSLAQPFASSPEAPVDCHFHIFAANQSVPSARYQPAYTADLADWAGAATACGIPRGVLVQPSFLGTDNRLLCAALSHNPALRGVAVIDPEAASESLKALHDTGVRAIRLNLAGTDHDVSAWCRVPALWHALCGLGWHVQLHTDTGALPKVMASLLPFLPQGLPLVLDHFGKPSTASMQDDTLKLLAALRQQGRVVFAKLSGYYRLGGSDPKALTRLLLQVLGPEHLLWGSDWPCTNHEPLAHYAALRKVLDEVLESPQVRHQVLTQNPHRLYA